MGTVEVFWTIATRLGLTDEMVSNKVVMMRGDLFTVRNAQGSIFRLRGELGNLDKFDWLEPTAGLFHLQMNLLTMLLDKLWGKCGNVASLSRYQGVLKRPNVSKDMKNFHACDTFFRHVVDAHIVALLMETIGHKGIDEFKAWVAQSDWPRLIEKVQELYLRPSYIQFLRAKGKRESKLAVDIALMGRKEE